MDPFEGQQWSPELFSQAVYPLNMPPPPTWNSQHAFSQSQSPLPPIRMLSHQYPPQTPVRQATPAGSSQTSSFQSPPPSTPAYSIAASVESQEVQESQESQEEVEVGGVRFVWAHHELQKLLEEANNQMDNGMRADSGIKEQALTGIRQAVLGVTAPDRRHFITLDSCQNKLRSMKGEWKVWKEVVKASSAGIDPITGAVTLPPTAKAAYIKAHKSAAKFFKKPLQFITLCDELFGGTAATGQHARALTVANMLSSGEDQQLGQNVHVDEATMRRRITNAMDRAEKAAKRQRKDDSLTDTVASLISALREPIRVEIQPTPLSILTNVVFTAECAKKLSIADKMTIVRRMKDEDMLLGIFVGLDRGTQEVMVFSEVDMLLQSRQKAVSVVRQSSPDWLVSEDAAEEAVE